MHCLDCSLANETRPAVGICTTCGAAVCRDCVRVGHNSVPHSTGFSSADLAFTEIRQLACLPCATALSARHAREYGFAPPTLPPVETQ
ncbi:DUF2180 family protein [Amycolatopsis echigonensis]|uniref:DUF2180 family protein n=1 Tax=Amycolatopsis echigonensis TaxID=2576905 RepID=A0A2N3WLH9_9PSEU|nr:MULTISPECIES: DUF2180 family protein [Amycolatopsis]MBB2500797.1 DUF2180 family protein [Amycolatopsis echigonensis]MCG3751246.1 DUF2180 family protein [Amycolatopsis sp. Poz14]PKV94710.1 uncharacterized protein DUF2180 [Amycolatopsis niigatensis]